MAPGARRCAFTLLGAALAVIWMVNVPGCAQLRTATTPEASPSPAATESAEPTPTATPPGASVDITYTRNSDYLVSFAVVKYTGTRLLETHDSDTRHNSSIVLFEGGVPTWEFAAGRGLLGHLGFDQDFAVHKVVYGQLPKGFVSSMPPSGPPEPLEPGRFYIFSVTRHSGITSYEAVKVLDDGSLEGYSAEPMAGSSFELCCNLNSDFISPTGPPQ
jgi:hypothetical protein